MSNLSKRINPFLERINDFKHNKSNQTPISWQEFNHDIVKNAGRRVVVCQKDFASGTLRIKASCWLQLAENISFNPNRGFNYKTAPEITGCDKKLEGGHNWFPTHKQLTTTYDKHAYRLGFFTAIAVETKDVWIDLNSFTLEQSAEHRLMQRFYSNIELTDQPFLPKQGPAHFGPTVDPAENIIISGGTFGRSSHHGIHGNNNKNVLFIDLTLKNYEVAGISLNGAEGVTYYKVNLLGNATKIPVLGTFSALRFMDQFVLEYLKRDGCKELIEKLRLSRLAQQQILYNKVWAGKGCIRGVDARLKSLIDKNFINESGLVDGNAYAILHHRSGVAVNNFLEEVKEYKTKDIYLHDVKINNTKAKVIEIVALAKKQESSYKNLVDVAGSVLQIDNIVHSNGNYKYTILSDYKITLAKYVNRLSADRRKHYGTLHIPNEICKWSVSGYSIARFLQNDAYKRVRNGDSMHHQQKAVLAIRMDGVDGLILDQVTITNTFNYGGHGVYDVYYTGKNDGGHPSQSGNEPNMGYMGADVRAIGLFCVKNFIINKTQIKKVISHYGKSVGIDIQGDSNGSVLDSGVSYVLACATNKLNQGLAKNTNIPFGCGIRVGVGAGVDLVKTSVIKVSGGSVWVKSYKYLINNNDSNIINKETNQPIVKSLVSQVVSRPSQEIINLMFMFIIFLVLIIFLTYMSRRYAKK